MKIRSWLEETLSNTPDLYVTYKIWNKYGLQNALRHVRTLEQRSSFKINCTLSVFPFESNEITSFQTGSVIQL